MGPGEFNIVKNKNSHRGLKIIFIYIYIENKKVIKLPVHVNLFVTKNISLILV